MVTIIPHVIEEQLCMDHLMQQGLLQVTHWPA